jgi:hypothetical protein
VEGNSDEARIYIATAPDMYSELCIPIEMSGRILWILNLEAKHTDAFTLGEVETLKGIIGQMQASLTRIFQRLILFQVLDVVPGAVVITEPNGKILHYTKDALRMFERESIASTDNLGEFLPASDTSAGFPALRPSQKRVTVVGARGKQTSVLAQKFTLEDEYDHEVVVLQDASEVRWKRDFELFKVALSEAAAQVRVPVSLLSSFVQQIGQEVKDEEVQDLVAKAMRQLGRVELTYDRVLASYDAQTLPSSQDIPIDVNGALDYILSELPALERRSIRVSAGKGQPLVNADPYQVLFALGSMLAYLLRSRASAERIVIKVHRAEGAVDVAMTGAVRQTPRRGRLADLVEAARTRIALGENALVRIAKDHGGNFERRPQGQGRERLCLRLAARH